MQISSINALAASWLMLCLVSPLQSDPQNSYTRSHGLYHPASNPLYPSSFVEDVPPQISRPRVPYTRLVPPPPSPARRPEYDYASAEIRGAWTPTRYAYPSKDSALEAGKPEAKRLAKPSRGKLNSVYENPASRNLTGTREDRVKFPEVGDEPQAEDEEMEEEIAMKMKILERVLSEEPVDKDLETNTIEDLQIISETSLSEESKRVARQVRKQRPGFFWTLARVTFETINDTRSAIKQISTIINNSISPDPTGPSNNGPLRVSTAVPPTSSEQTNVTESVTGANATTSRPTTTTEEPFVLTRSGLQTIIRRNVLGLIRLFNIEWKDAVNESELSVRQFQKDLGNQIGSYLQDNPDNY